MCHFSTLDASPDVINYATHPPPHPKLQGSPEKDIFRLLLTSTCRLLGYGLLVELMVLVPSAQLEDKRTKRLSQTRRQIHLLSARIKRVLCLVLLFWIFCVFERGQGGDHGTNILEALLPFVTSQSQRAKKGGHTLRNVTQVGEKDEKTNSWSHNNHFAKCLLW